MGALVSWFPKNDGVTGPYCKQGVGGAGRPTHFFDWVVNGRLREG